jgi:hypothetical protein
MEAPDAGPRGPAAPAAGGGPPPPQGVVRSPGAGRPRAAVRAVAPWDDRPQGVVLEALRRLDDPVGLQRLTPLTRLRAVQERAARQYHDGWCATGRALRDVLRAAVEPVAEVLPPQAAEVLRAVAAGGTAAGAARRCGVNPGTLRKRATPLIEEALLRYLEHLELERGGPA